MASIRALQLPRIAQPPAGGGITGVVQQAARERQAREKAAGEPVPPAPRTPVSVSSPGRTTPPPVPPVVSRPPVTARVDRMGVRAPSLPATAEANIPLAGIAPGVASYPGMVRGRTPPPVPAVDQSRALPATVAGLTSDSFAAPEPTVAAPMLGLALLLGGAWWVLRA